GAAGKSTTLLVGLSFRRPVAAGLRAGRSLPSTPTDFSCVKSSGWARSTDWRSSWASPTEQAATDAIHDTDRVGQRFHAARATARLSTSFRSVLSFTT